MESACCNFCSDTVSVVIVDCGWLWRFLWPNFDEIIRIIEVDSRIYQTILKWRLEIKNIKFKHLMPVSGACFYQDQLISNNTFDTPNIMNRIHCHLALQQKPLFRFMFLNYLFLLFKIKLHNYDETKAFMMHAMKN